MIPSPTDYRRLATDDGWVLFFWGSTEVFGYVWDVDWYRCCFD